MQAHSVDSSELAFRIAAQGAVREGIVTLARSMASNEWH
jgi:hypothetical protein